jgi:exodeoxyribonuclease V gamma subunit
MRAIPHRVLILMGLDAGAFPRQRQRPGFHLLETSRQLGDPDPADQDRYALLEALLSARDHLLITWNGLEERTGVALPPAVPVQQWLQWLQSVLPTDQAAALQVAHDPNPLDPSHFLPRGDRPPSSCDRRQLEACRQLRQDLPPPEPGLAATPLPPPEGPPSPEEGLPPAEPGVADPFDDLRAWLLAPQEAWLRELGMAPREWEQEVDDLEALELEERERTALLREALEGEESLAREREAFAEGAELWLRHQRGRGRFPPAQGALLEANRLEDRWRSLQGVLEGLGGEELRPLLQWERWRGSVSLLGDAVVLVRAARGRVRDRLDLWLHLQLAVAALEGEAPRRGLLIARGSSQGETDAFAPQLTFQAPEPEAARQELARLWRLRQTWRSTCWPVPPKTGWAWMAEGGLAHPEKAFAKATEAWEGNAFQGGGEREEEAMRLCFGSERTLDQLLEELPFAEQAAALFPPLLEAIPAPEKGQR